MPPQADPPTEHGQNVVCAVFFALQRGGWLLAMVTEVPIPFMRPAEAIFPDIAGGSTVRIGHVQLARRAIMPQSAYSDFQKLA